jgi:hypothetical protein
MRCCWRLLHTEHNVIFEGDKHVQFAGYRVAGAVNDIEVVGTIFDETDLSDTSNWQEAWQNEDPAEDHGYVDPLSMLQDVCRRIAGELSAHDLELQRAVMRGGGRFAVKTIEDLARLIQFAVPAAAPSTAPRNVRTVAADDGQEIPFD